MTSKTTLALAEAKLAESGLTLADAKELGFTFHDDIKPLYREGDEAEWRSGPGIKIPYHGLTGEPIEAQPGWGKFWRVRRLLPPAEKTGFDAQTTGKLADGVKKKVDHKYDQPPRTGTTAYFPKNMDWPEVALDTERSIILTEGEFKAAKACKEGIATIGLGGVWNYKSNDMAVLFLPVLEEIDWVRRTVYIVYDSDVKENEHVAKSINQLAEQLWMRGAIPYCIFLPEIEGLKKTGLDDYLVHSGTETLKDLCVASQVNHLMNVKEMWAWNDEWYHITLKPHCVVNRRTGDTYKKDEYVSAHTAKEYPKKTIDGMGNIRIEMVSLVKEVFDWPLHSRLDRLEYDPSKPPLQKIEGQSAFNCWPGWGLEPIEGDVRPYMELMDIIFGNDANEAKWFLQWLAYQFQHPGVKLSTAVLITGTHGSGKSMLADAVMPIFGVNGSEVSNEEFFGQFNEWAAKKQFVLANEVIAAGDRDRNQHASALKNYITRKQVTINEKYGLKYVMQDRTNIYMTANPRATVPIEPGERRYFVYRSAAPQMSPGCEFLQRWDRWKESGGINALFYYLLHKVDTSKFVPTAPAMQTDAVVDVVEYGETNRDYEMKQIMENGFQVGEISLNSDLMTVEEILTNANGLDKKVFNGPADVRRALKDNKALKIEDPSTPDKRIRINGRYYVYWALRNQDKWKKASIEEVKAYLKANDTSIKKERKF